MTGPVHVRSSRFGGRGVFAEKSFGPGEEIFCSRSPLISALDRSRLGETCANCLKWDGDAVIGVQEPLEESPLKACTGCRTFKYCRKVCPMQINSQHSRNGKAVGATDFLDRNVSVSIGGLSTKCNVLK